MGYRSNRALIVANACLIVSRDGGSVTITVGTKGTKGGYTYPLEPDVATTAIPIDVGEAIKELAAHVTSSYLVKPPKPRPDEQAR